MFPKKTVGFSRRGPCAPTPCMHYTGKDIKSHNSRLAGHKNTKIQNKKHIRGAKNAFPSANMHTNLRVILVVATNFFPGMMPIMAPMSLSGSDPALRSSATYSCQLPKINANDDGTKQHHSRNQSATPKTRALQLPRQTQTKHQHIWGKKRVFPLNLDQLFTSFGAAHGRGAGVG